MFVFKGISSEEMDVLAEEEDVFLTRAAQRYEKIEIEGRDGAIFNEQGYSCVEKNVKLQILDIEKIDKILAWLNGTGELEYNGRITKARFYTQLDVERIVTIKNIDAGFIRDPFWNKKRDEYTSVRNIIFSEGNIYSKPIIKLERNTSDKVDITINDIRFVYNFNNEQYVEIDCEKQTVSYEAQNRNRQIEIGYKFPVLYSGINKVIINSGNADIKAKRKDRWL